MPHYVDNNNYPTNYNGYLKLGLAAGAAKVSTVLDIQGQQIQNNLTSFQKFVNAAAAQAQQANGHITILVGLTTTPKTYTAKNPVSAQQLINAYCSEHSLFEAATHPRPAGGLRQRTRARMLRPDRLRARDCCGARADDPRGCNQVSQLGRTRPVS
jgi:hypothetical protein